MLSLFKNKYEYLMCVFNPGLAVALQLLHGDIEQLRREYMVLFTRGVSITKKLGFSDVIMPGENKTITHYILERLCCDKSQIFATNVSLSADLLFSACAVL